MTFAEEMQLAAKQVRATPVIGDALANWLTAAAFLAGTGFVDPHALKTARAINTDCQTPEEIHRA